MITLKSLGRKLRKLEGSMQQDAKRLSKLIRKIEKAGASEASRKPRSRATVEKPKGTATAAPAKPKRNLSPEGRAKLSAAMNARWAAKRAAAAVPPQPSDAPVAGSATPASDGPAPRAGRGRRTSSPAQLGQTLFSTPAHSAQKVQS